MIQGNTIGIDGADRRPLPNGVGVFLSDVSGNLIGGADPSAGNTISGNTTAGVYIYGHDATGNVVAGNIVGLDRAGLFPIALSLNPDPNVAIKARQNVGVLINGAVGNIVGGGARPATSSRATWSGSRSPRSTPTCRRACPPTACWAT